jgi:hypothetical protein
LKGRVLRVEPKADAVTEETLAKVTFDNKPEPLPPVGELAEVTVDLPALPAAPLIPNAAVQREGDKVGVWQIVDGDLHFSPVKLGTSDLNGYVQVREGLKNGDQVVTYSEKALTARSRIHVVEHIPEFHDDQPGRPRHSPCLGKFVFTGIGLGLLIGVTLVMAGVYRGMVDDGKALLDNSGADLWVVQKDTLGPYAESSSLNDDVYRAILAMPGVSQAANATYLTMQVRKGESDVRTMVVGIAPGALGATPGWPPYLVAGRQITRSLRGCGRHRHRLQTGDRLAIRRNHYTVVGLTRRMVSSSGDPMVFIPLKDAQEAQFLKDNDAIWQSRRRTEANPVFNRPGDPGCWMPVMLHRAATRSSMPCWSL